MSIHLLQHSLNSQCFRVECHILAILCAVCIRIVQCDGPGSNLLNLICSTLGSLEALGNNLVVTFIFCRASGGRKERNRRAVFALGEKGLKTLDTSVMNLVSILTSRGPILQSG